MKISKKNRFLIILFVVAMLATSVAFRLFNGKTGSAEFAEIEIQAEYGKNETLNVPETTLSVENGSYPAVSVVEYPSGKTTENKSVVLSESGKYRLIYRAVVNGKVYEKNYEFGVKDKLYEVVGGDASVKYGSHEYIPEVNGLLLTLTHGATFKYNKIIDLSGLSGDEILFKFFILPERIGSLDVSKINVTLTDVYDEDNYITLTAKSKLATAENPNNNSMCTANPVGQMAIGLEKCAENETSALYPIISWNGARWKKFVGNQFGSYLGGYVSFIGLPRYGDIKNNSIAFCMDYKERTVYNQNHVGDRNPVADLDDMSMFSNPWKGFTTGECFLTVSGETFQNSKATILITDILYENLAADNVYVDDEKPELTVDFDGYEEGVPTGAKREKYNIFKASAFDKKDGATDVSVNVYYDYFHADGKVSVYTNGEYFTPGKEGVYVVEYSAKDKSGNVAVVTVPVKVVSDDKNTRLNIVLGDDGDGSGVVGNEIKIKSARMQNAKGKSGYTAYAVNVAEGVRYAVTENLTFTPLYSGKYKIVYEFYDHVYSMKEEYEINVSDGNKAYLDAKGLAIPKYLIKNAEYVFPAVTAYSFSGGKPNVVQTYIAVYNDGKTDYRVYKNQDKIKIDAEKSVLLRYYAANANTDNAAVNPDDPNVVYKDFPINDVRDVGYGTSGFDMANYFATKNFTTSAKSEYVEFSAVKGAEDAEAEFINMLGINGFAFNIKILSGVAEKTNVYLNDAVTGKLLYKITYIVGESTVMVKLNDRVSYTFAKTESDIRSSFDVSNETVTPYYGSTMSIGKLYNGESVNTILGRMLYLKFENKNVDEDFRFAVSKICNQPISNTKSDKIAPVVSDIDLSGYFEINDKLILNAAYAYDVLSPYTDFSLSVIDSDGNTITSANGVRLKDVEPSTEETISLDKYGKYTFRYVAKDGGNGRANEQLRSISVIDSEKPTIILKSGKTEGKPNKKIKIADYTVSDNLDDKLAVNIYVIAPDNSVTRITDGEFTPRLSGEYKVYYSVEDTQGNLSQVYYTITVGE